ncbi:hypothetical protein ACSLVQ_27330, partial [Klebsiella pneumoniae]|uniref:hypothetical protein n=1 Tax=Klebsiella pneumoniae TaxID=573 RepID=UPI003EE24E6D
LKANDLALGDFMFMHETAQGICTYKHCNTRRSLHIDSLGNFYRYNANEREFLSQTEAEALEHVKS